MHREILTKSQRLYDAALATDNAPMLELLDSLRPVTDFEAKLPGTKLRDGPYPSDW